MSDTYYYPRGFTYPPVIVPDDYPVRPLAYTEQPTGRMTCGNCGLSWDDDISTAVTPVPSGRCPFEYFHPGADDDDEQGAGPADDSDTYRVLDANGDTIATTILWWVAARTLRESGGPGWSVIDSAGAVQAEYVGRDSE